MPILALLEEIKVINMSLDSETVSGVTLPEAISTNG